jgi:hypothetical protein
MKKKGLYNSSSCIGFKCKKLNKSALKFYSKKHKFTPSCFNTCVDWTLNVSFLQDKMNYSNVSIIIITLIFIENKRKQSLF